MGGSTYSSADYDAKVSYKRAAGIATMAYDDDIKKGKAVAKVHDRLNPKGVKVRESRDSVEHPITVPIAVILDTTGSMGRVPEMMQKKLNELMGGFLNDKASGKKYLGDGYPAILIGAIDDYNAQKYSYPNGEGTLQMGQFESGLEIDENLECLWLTDNGGGTYHENYDAALYFLAEHSVHDHWEKRGQKGYIFMIGDEHAYPATTKELIKDVIGDSVQADIPFEDILNKVKERYHVFMIIPNMTSHYNDLSLEKWWLKQLGQQYVIKLSDPDKIVETIVSAVALSEEFINPEDLSTDSVADASVLTALAPLVKASNAVSRYSAEGLPAVAGDAGGISRL